jgi:hypothetical protein
MSAGSVSMSLVLSPCGVYCISTLHQILCGNQKRETVFALWSSVVVCHGYVSSNANVTNGDVRGSSVCHGYVLSNANVTNGDVRGSSERHEHSRVIIVPLRIRLLAPPVGSPARAYWNDINRWHVFTRLVVTGCFECGINFFESLTYCPRGVSQWLGWCHEVTRIQYTKLHSHPHHFHHGVRLCCAKDCLRSVHVPV